MDIIKVKDLEVGKLFWIIQVGEVLKIRGHVPAVNRKQDMEEKGQKRCHIADFEDGGRSNEPKNAVSLWKLEKASKWILPYSLQKGTKTYSHTDFSLLRTRSNL